MNELPLDMQRKINCYKPIETEGFVLYPFKVANYEEYMLASRAIGYVTQSLPIELMSMPLLSAFYKMDFEALINGKEISGLFSECLVALALSLRLFDNNETAEQMCERFQIFTYPDDPSKLKCLRYAVNGEDEVKEITPTQFARLRPIIAAQNGIEIANEMDNPELLEAERDINSANAPKLDYRIDSLVNATATLTGKDEEEIMEWAILKMNNRLDTYKKIINYIICGIGESQGTKWKGGNPYPHPWFERIKEGSNALIPLGGFMGGAGVQAMKEAGAI